MFGRLRPAVGHTGPGCGWGGGSSSSLAGWLLGTGASTPAQTRRNRCGSRPRFGPSPSEKWYPFSLRVASVDPSRGLTSHLVRSLTVSKPRGLPIGGDIGCGQRRPREHHIKERRRNPAAERAVPSTAHRGNAPEGPARPQGQPAIGAAAAGAMRAPICSNMQSQRREHQRLTTERRVSSLTPASASAFGDRISAL